MPRVAKHPDVRRDELLDVALELIMTTGFTPMSVEQVTNAAGVAKGTFYYYFRSKQRLLEALVERFGDSLFTHLDTYLGQVDGSGLERLRALLLASSSWKLERANATALIAPFLLSDTNLPLRHHLFTEWLERTRELLEPIIGQGHTDGSFDVADARGTTGVVLSLWYDGGVRVWDRALAAPDEPTFVDELVRGSNALSAALERVLGAPRGSLTVPVDPASLAGLRDHCLAELQRTTSPSAERRTP